MYLNEVLIKNLEYFLDFIKLEEQDTYLFIGSAEDYLINDYVKICKEENLSIRSKIIPVNMDEIKNKERIVLNAKYLKIVLQELASDNYDQYMQIRYSENNWQLNVNGKELFVLERRFCDLIYDRLSIKEPKDIYVAFHIADHCNLNCQMCNKFSPLAKEKFISAEGIIKDAFRLAEISNGEIPKINITGGEPLLHPELEKIIEGIHQAFPECEIQLQTNGTKLKEKGKSFFELCKRNNVFILMTRYPIPFDYSEIEKMCKENSVRTMRAVEEEKTSWKFPIDVDGKQEKYMTLFCWMHGKCINVLEGKLYPCGFMHASRHFEKYFGYQFVRNEEDSLDLYSIKNFEDIAVFLSQFQPFCRYCNIKKWEVDLPWDTSKRKVDEWI